VVYVYQDLGPVGVELGKNYGVAIRPRSIFCGAPRETDGAYPQQQVKAPAIK
jgi:hypothetical protein